MSDFSSSRLKVWTLRLLKWAVIVELAWLVVVNALLALPLTQDLISAIRPEKFHARWERAWTPYPARFYVTRAYANGNARSQIWAFSAESVSGSVALLPLVLKRVWISNVEGRDLEFRMRPRLKPDRDYSAIEAYFPEIAGREVTPALPPPPRKRWPWNVSVRDIEVGGRVAYWVYNLHGSADTEISGGLNYRTRGGPFELDVRTMDLESLSMYLNGDQAVFEEGRIRGSMGFAPFRPRENKGLKLLDHLLLDAEVDIDSKSLAFIDAFLLNFEGMHVDGTGQVSGQLHFEQGWVRDGTDLQVDADDMSVRILNAEISGFGTIELAMDRAARRDMSLDFDFRELAVRHEEDAAAFLTGEQLSMRIGGNGRVVPDPEAPNLSRTIDLGIDALAVPDLGLLQRFLPRKWPFVLHGGDGTLSGSARVAPTELNVDLRLDSENADMGFGQYRFETNLHAALRLDNPDIVNQRTSVAGTAIALTGAHLMRDGERAPEPWAASLALESGEFGLVPPEVKQDKGHVVDLLRIIAEREVNDIVGESSGRFDFNATVSSLAWVGVLLDGRFRSEFGGRADITGTASLADGLPAPGTDVTVTSDRLAVGILDYRAAGYGRIRLEVDEGGEFPDWRFGLALRDAGMRRRDEDETYIEDVELNLEALVEDVSFDPGREREFALHLGIPSARVTDMSVFNRHLPPDSPFLFSGGEAGLSADIDLQTDDADGWLRLRGRRIEASLEEQQIEADLDVDIELVGGRPEEMFFDLSGSSVLIDGVKVAGEREAFDAEDWSARLLLTRAETTWTNPPEMEAEARLVVSDSRPFVALFNNTGWKPKALSRAMTVEDIEGDARLLMSGNRIRIPHAQLNGDTVEFRAKGVIGEPAGDGVVYARYKKLGAAIRFKDGRKSLIVIKPLEKFERYELPP